MLFKMPEPIILETGESYHERCNLLNLGRRRARSAGYAPYLDYRPPLGEELTLTQNNADLGGFGKDLEARVQAYAVTELVPEHLEAVRRHKEALVDKTMVAVRDRLTKEINYWDYRATTLKDQELAGKINARLNSGLARQRADELTGRLERRMKELQEERLVSPLPPVITGVHS